MGQAADWHTFPAGFLGRNSTRSKWWHWKLTSAIFLQQFGQWQGFTADLWQWQC